MRKKIVILSAYNRALWLSTELKSKGHDVIYMDFSHRLGGLSPEAWDPPFGIFQTKKLNYSQNVFLNEGAALKKVETGFVILAEKGPIEFQGPLNKQSYHRYHIDQDQLDYIKTSLSMGPEAFLKFKYHFDSAKFENIWCLHLAHQLASQTYFDNAQAINNKNRPLPILENWVLRTISRRGAHEILEITAGKGVQVYDVKAIKNTKQLNGNLTHIEISTQNGTDHEVAGDLFLNFLSQEELSCIHAQTFSHMIDAQPLTADWFWTRYRFFTNQNDVTEVLPEAFLMIDDRYLPWSHQNLLLIHRGLRSHEFIIWCRIPGHYRLQEKLLQTTGEEIKKVFLKHLPGVEIQQVELPLECLATEFQVQAPHLPVFSQDKLAELKKSKLKNVMLCGPEQWARLDTTFLLDYQQEILEIVLGTNDEQGISRRRGRDQEIYS